VISIAQFLEEFTYLGVFLILFVAGLGVPIPEELPIMAGGVLAHEGVVRWWLMLPVCVLGVLSGDVALYWIDVTNDIVPFNGGAYFFTAGKSRRRGGELGLDWTPMNPLTVRGALTLSNNEYVEYENDLGNFDGNEVAGLPSTFADGEVRWRLVPGFSVAGRWKHVDDYFVDDANTASVEAFDIFGAEAEYTRPLSFGSLRAFVAVENLSDEDYVASAFINGINGQYFEPGLPRNVSAGLTFMFR